MVRHTLKILQQMLQDFKSVSDHFGTLCIKGLILKLTPNSYYQIIAEAAIVNLDIFKF